MSNPYLAEVRAYGFNYAPRGWAQCDGQTLPMGQNAALYSLLGTQFGGDGRTTFKLPDMRSRTPVGIGGMYAAGDVHGVERVTLTQAQMAAHSHVLQATSTDAQQVPDFTNNVFATSRDLKSTGTNPYVYSAATNLTSMATDMVSSLGGGQSHFNIQPSLAINFCIAITGVYPSRND